MGIVLRNNGTANNPQTGLVAPKTARTPSGPLPWVIFLGARGLELNMEFFCGGVGAVEKSSLQYRNRSRSTEIIPVVQPDPAIQKSHPAV